MPRGDRSTATRDELLAAAARVFVMRGYHGATVREIVGEAGFTNPALYYHFEGKAQLYSELVKSGLARFRELVEQAIGQHADAIRRLEAVIAAYLRFGREDSLRLRFLYGEIFRPREAEAPRLELEEFRSWLHTRIEEVLREGIAKRELAIADVAEVRRLFLALLSGLRLEQAREPELPILNETRPDAVLSALLNGVAKRKEIA